MDRKIPASLLCFFFIGLNLSLAQPFADLVNIEHSRYGSSQYTHDAAAMSRHAETTINLMFPWQLNKKNILLWGAEIRDIEFEYQGNPADREKLNSTNLNIGWRHVLTDTSWAMSMIAIPRLARNLRHIESSDCSLAGVLLFAHRVSKSLVFKFGLYYHHEFFCNRFFPLAGIDWIVNPDIRIYGVFPGSINAEFRLSPHFYTGISGRNNSTSFRLNSGPDNHYVVEGDKDLGSNKIYGFLDYYATKNLVIYANTGFTLLRYFQLYEEPAQKRTDHVVFNEQASQLFFSLGAAFRIRFKD